MLKEIEADRDALAKLTEASAALRVVRKSGRVALGEGGRLKLNIAPPMDSGHLKRSIF